MIFLLSTYKKQVINMNTIVDDDIKSINREQKKEFIRFPQGQRIHSFHLVLYLIYIVHNRDILLNLLKC